MASFSIFAFILFTFLPLILSDDLKYCDRWEVGSDLSMETYLKQFHKTSIANYVKNLNKTNKPNVNWYLPSLLIDYHLSKFNLSGAGFVHTSSKIQQSNFSYIGDDDGQFISTYPETKSILMNCSQYQTQNDKVQCLGNKLGFPSDYIWFTKGINNTNGLPKVMFYNINETWIQALNIRMAGGNESSANELWIPGGYTSSGIREAVIDQIQYPMYCWEAISDENGTFCYPNCGDIIFNKSNDNNFFCNNQPCIQSYCDNYNQVNDGYDYKFYFKFLHSDDDCITPINQTNATNGGNNNCNDDNNDSFMDQLISYGTLVGFGVALIFSILMCLIGRFCCGIRIRLEKTKSNFLSDQFSRDTDQYLL